MPSERDPLVHIEDMLEAVRAIRSFLDGVDELEDYLRDLKTRYAVERALLIVSEAAVRLGEDGPRLCPALPWGDIRGLGNHLRHGYDTLRHPVVWDVLRNHLPQLEAAFARLLAEK